MKAISYSIFAPSKDNWADLETYLRGLAINLRLNKLLYPLWTTVLHLDKSTYSAYQNLFDGYVKCGRFQFRICDDAPLTKAMLWRMKPIFEKDQHTNHVWDAVLCRDLDSPTTYREVQAVEQWISSGKAAHAITDSSSHVIPMMGGMVGFIPKHFKDYASFSSWEEMFKDSRRDFSVKGADQDFLCNEIYPMFISYGRDSMMQHYFLGMRNTYINGFLTCDCRRDDSTYHKAGCPLNIKVSISNEFESTNDLCGHIGAAGAYMPIWDAFERKYRDEFLDLIEIEKEYSNVFYWAK